jgi:hypothetical protein
VLWYHYSFGHNKFSKLYTLFCYTLYIPWIFGSTRVFTIAQKTAFGPHPGPTKSTSLALNILTNCMSRIGFDTSAFQSRAQSWEYPPSYVLFLESEPFWFSSKRRKEHRKDRIIIIKKSFNFQWIEVQCHQSIRSHLRINVVIIT